MMKVELGQAGTFAACKSIIVVQLNGYTKGQTELRALRRYRRDDY